MADLSQRLGQSYMSGTYKWELLSVDAGVDQEGCRDWDRGLTHLVQAWAPPNFKKAQYAARPSDCAATLESATAPFHRLGSCMNGTKTGCDSSGVFSNCPFASSYPSFRTFQFCISVLEFQRSYRSDLSCRNERTL